MRTSSGYSRIASEMERKMTPARSSSSRKVVATRDAVEHRVDRDLARALDAGEHLLLLDRDAELFVDAQDLGIDLVEAAELRLRLGLGIIIGVLEIDLRDVELGPAHLLHGQPGAIGLEPPFEHPFGLVLLGRDEADRVLVQALGRELLLDVGGEAPFVGRGAVDRVLGLLVADVDLVALMPSPAARLERLTPWQRAAHGAVDHAHVRADLAGAFERAIVPLGVDAGGHRDRPFDRLDDVGEADRRGRPGEADSAARAAASIPAGRRRRGG